MCEDIRDDVNALKEGAQYKDPGFYPGFLYLKSYKVMFLVLLIKKPLQKNVAACISC